MGVDIGQGGTLGHQPTPSLGSAGSPGLVGNNQNCPSLPGLAAQDPAAASPNN